MEPVAGDDVGFRRLATTHPEQSLYVFGDQGVVYSETENRFAGLDAAGVAAFRAFDHGADPGELQPPASLGAPASPPQSLLAVHALAHGVFPPEDPSPAWPAPAESRSANLALDRIPICLEPPAGPAGRLCRDVFRNCPSARVPARCHLAARVAADGWTVLVNGQALLSGLRDEQLGLAFLHAARSLLYAEAAYDVAFHAAALSCNGRGILLSGPRESGKSTLAALLLAHGCELLADEPALLRLDTASIAALPLPISLKQGSWPALEPLFPLLAAAPTHVRSDGTPIRLLHPAPGGPPERETPLASILFPAYRPSSPGLVRRLGPFETLACLNHAGMILGSHLRRAGFEFLLATLCRTPAFAVQYSHWEDVAEILLET